jgi:hypothetical protein
MFGQFQQLLRDFPDPPPYETIPHFHDGPKRFENFREVFGSDPFNRAQSAKPDIDFVFSKAGLFDVLPNLTAQGRIPVCVTHNDTKVNNVLLDESTGKGVCVIDLDTVMPGVSLYDFGDLARSTLSPMAEDQQDSSHVTVEIPRFEAILNGFLAGTGGNLNRTERDHLVFSGILMTLIIGMRFLTDYLQGDTYYKIQHKNQNLDRCRRQFKLVKAIIECQEEMNAIVTRHT